MREYLRASNKDLPASISSFILIPNALPWKQWHYIWMAPCYQKKSNSYSFCSFDLELTGRSYPSSEISKSTKTIERRSKKFCYHHHIEEPTKVVALDPLPNNSSSGPSVGLGAGGTRATSGERWRATSVDTGLPLTVRLGLNWKKNTHQWKMALQHERVAYTRSTITTFWNPRSSCE